MDVTPAQILRETRVPGSELLKRAFYESVTGFRPAATEGCPYGCTITQTKQGPYVLDHVRRVAYPLASLSRPGTVDGTNSNGRDGVDASGKGGGAEHVSASAREVEEAVARQVAARSKAIASEVREKERAIHDLQKAVRMRKEEVQALQRKLTKMHHELKTETNRAAKMEEQLRRERLRAPLPQSAVVTLPLTTASAAGQPVRMSSAGHTTVSDGPPPMSALLPSLTEHRRGQDEDDDDDVAGGAVTERRVRKRDRSRGREKSSEDKHSRTLRYGDARIGVADDDESSSSSSSSSSSWSSSSSSSYSRSSFSSSSSPRGSSRSPSRRRHARRADARVAKTDPDPSEKEEEAAVRVRRESYRSAATRRGSDTAGSSTAPPVTHPSLTHPHGAVVNKESAAPSAATNLSATPEANATPNGSSSSSSGSNNHNNNSDSGRTGTGNPHPSAAPESGSAVGAPPSNATATRDGGGGSAADQGAREHPDGHSPSPAPQLAATPIATKASMPMKLVQGTRAVMAFCHVCRTFFAPHPVNLRQHILSSGHQRLCTQVDAFIRSGAFTGGAPAAAGGAESLAPEDIVWHRGAAQRQMRGSHALKGRSSTNRSEFGKVILSLPEYITATSVMDAAAREDESKGGNSFFAEGFDLVRSTCDLCDEPVSAQSYKMHEGTPKHRERAAAVATTARSIHCEGCSSLVKEG